MKVDISTQVANTMVTENVWVAFRSELLGTMWKKKL